MAARRCGLFPVLRALSALLTPEEDKAEEGERTGLSA